MLLACAALLAPIGSANAAGLDLTGAITAPETGEAGEVVSIPIELRNIGDQPAPAFRFRITIDPDEMADGSEPTRHDLVWMEEVTEGLAAGAEIIRVISAPLPSPIRGDLYTFELELDFQRQLADADRTNNRVVSATKMVNRKPSLQIERNTWELNLVDGCFYGEPIEATLRTCNSGRAEAAGFLPGVVMGELEQLTLIEDVAAATFPQSCHSEAHANFNPCEPMGDQMPLCVADTCRLECEVDEDCGSELFCLDDPLLAAHLGKTSARSCMNYLGFPPTPGASPRCQTYTIKGRIPVANQQGTYYRNQSQRFHFISDVAFSLSESRPHQISTEPFECREALPDLVPISLAPKQVLLAGEATPISRVFRNGGFIQHPRVLPPEPPPATVDFEYQYYLSTVPDISVNQVPLVIQSSPDGVGKAAIARKGENAHTDLVLIPPHTAPGEYYIGVIADPTNKIRELSELNNVLVHSEKIQVVEASLRITSDHLPTATLGARFTHQLVAQGGIFGYRWSATDLPPGIELDEDGTLSGTPTDVGLFPFTVTVTSGDHLDWRMLVLRTIPPQGSLEITTTALPPAVRNAAYGGWTDEFGIRHEGLPLAASGGTPPYRWSLDPSVEENFMPQGLELLTPDGVVYGTPSTQSESRDVVLLVEDQLGNRAVRSLRVVVIGSADLVITTELFAEGTTAQPYDSCVEATGGDRRTDYLWQVDPATVPPGLEVVIRSNRACLVGSPRVCTNYLVKTTVSDAAGQSYTASIPLSVECEPIQLSTQSLPPVHRGDVVNEQLQSTGKEGVKFRLYQGRLPSGITLGEDGSITGTVAEDADYGSHSFIVHMSDGEGRQGLGALALTVKTDPVEPVETKVEKSGGCAGASGAGGLVAIALSTLGITLARRRREAA